ncbi:hypothetical protein WA026_016159 [Henosepilachna vigintioctopunctata]|uniref:Uncharacterized protein n=1 Tax=Henosepilachna vigintioctopunctata TaxID=420089 RepID=A0AAW1TTU7_9CUCU
MKIFKWFPQWFTDIQVQSYSLQRWKQANNFSRREKIRGGGLILCSPSEDFLCFGELNDLSCEMHCELTATQNLLYTFNYYKRFKKSKIKQIRMSANDNIIKNSNNVSKSMWNLVNIETEKRQDIVASIPAQDFNNFFVYVPDETLKMLQGGTFEPVAEIVVSDGDTFAFRGGFI